MAKINDVMNTTEIPNNVLDDFTRWKEFLGDKITQAHSAGMTDQQISETAVQIGSFLSQKIDPKNPQERLLKQMWDISSKEDQKALARIMVSLVQKQPVTTR